MDRTCDPCRVKPSDVHRAGGVSLGSAHHGSPLACTSLHRDHTGRRKVIQCHTVLDTIPVVNVRDHEDNARALAHAFRAVHSAQWSRTGNAVARAFAFLGRCFVGMWRSLVARLLVPERGSGFSGRWFKSSHPHKAPSSSGRALTQQTGLHGLHPRNTGSGDQPEQPTRRWRSDRSKESA